jgi:beta-glucosidase
VRVDYDTQVRTVKDSGRAFARVIADARAGEALEETAASRV